MHVRQSDRLTMTDISEILDAAGYGIGYWASSATSLVSDSDSKARASDLNEVVYTIQDDSHHYAITMQALLDAWDRLTAPDQTDVGPMIASYFQAAIEDPDELDLGCIDSDAADVLIQIAAFDEVVNG